MIDLRNILRGHEGDHFWSPVWGNVIFKCIPKKEDNTECEWLWFIPGGSADNKNTNPTVFQCDQYGRIKLYDINEDTGKGYANTVNTVYSDCIVFPVKFENWDETTEESWKKYKVRNDEHPYEYEGYTIERDHNVYKMGPMYGIYDLDHKCIGKFFYSSYYGVNHFDIADSILLNKDKMDTVRCLINKFCDMKSEK